MRLESCIPSHKGDLAAVHQAEMVGFPTLNDILGDLLPWVKDPNWPITEKLTSVLGKAGPEIAPHLMAALVSQDEEWKLALLMTLGPHLGPQVQQIVRPALTRMMEHPSEAEAAATLDEAAKLLLTAWDR